MAGSAAQFPKKLGDYELVRHLATGGMAEVYLARRDGPHGFSKTVALKRILPQLVRDPDFVAMFIDEARVCAQLSHPNLVQVFDFGKAGSELYMAMEYVDGTTCAKLVRRAASREEHVPIEGALHIVLGVLRGLEYAHAAVDMNGVPLGLVHRDVSPGNILVARSGAVKLGDFGIARADDFERRTEEGQLKGKLGYMSPEQVTGRVLDARSDLFTLGIVFAEVLTAHPLYGAGTELDVLMRIRDADLSAFERHAGHVPEELRQIVRRALARDPDDRYPSAAAFAEEIEDVARQKRIAAGAPKLVAWLESAGLVSRPRSGEHSFDLQKAASSSPVPGQGAPAVSPPPPRRTPPARSAIRSPQPAEDPRPERSLPTPDLPPPAPSPRTAGADIGEISPAVYRVATDERILGPLHYARLVELLATGHADADTLVSRGNAPFRPARDLPELARLLSSPALAEAVQPEGQATETWQVERTALPMTLFDLAHRKATGLLVATQLGRVKKFFLVDGGPTFTTSTDKNELLGEQLVARGLVLPMEVDMALALCPRYGGRLGDALVGLGVLRPIELFRALVAQTHERFTDLLGWKHGTLQFSGGVRTEGETILHGASPFELVARGIALGYHDEEIEQLLGPFLDGLVRGAPSADAVSASLRLPARETAALARAAQPVEIERLVEECGARAIAGRGEVLRAVFVGLSARVLILTGWPPAQSFPSVPTQPM
jgi:serine/threonine-protein kinase